MNEIRSRIRELAEGAQLPAADQLTQHLDDLGLEYRLEQGDLRLPSPLELLDRETILASVNSVVRPELEVLWQVGSTNTFLMDRLQDEAG